MTWRIALIFLLLVHSRSSCADDYFTSIAKLENLWDFEASLIDIIDGAVQNLENYVELTATFIENTHNEIKQKRVRYHETPLSAFNILRRIVLDEGDAEKLLATPETTIDDFYNAEKDNNRAQPSLEDLKGAAMGLSRLQNTYQLKTEDIAAGILKDKQVSSPLSPHDSFMLGLHLYHAGKYSAANQWILQAKLMLNQEKDALAVDDFPTLYEKEVLAALVKSLIASGNLKLAERVNKKLQKHSKDMAVKNTELLEDALNKNRLMEPNAVDWKERKNETIFTKICNGESSQSPREQRELRCRYVCHVQPDCIISPFRVEEFSLDPYVGVFENIIYEHEMEFIKNISITKLHRSTVASGNELLNEIRTSQTRWIDSRNYTILRNLEHRMMQITGLSLDYKEMLQVVNYGIGGHYVPHYDFYGKYIEGKFKDMGDRILTLLLYINDVEMGGATAFPYLKIAVPPKKGSALVWFNMHKDLQGDYRTFHTGCPVMLGSKWITNQWFHEFGQEFKRPCGLEPDPSSEEYEHSHLKD